MRFEHKAQQISAGNFIFQGERTALKSRVARPYLISANPQQDTHTLDGREASLSNLEIHRTSPPGLFWFEAETNTEMINLKW